MKSDLVDLAAVRHAETEQAILISETADRRDAKWVPKAHCEIRNDGHANFVTVTMPEWLAIEKGFA